MRDLSKFHHSVGSTFFTAAILIGGSLAGQDTQSGRKAAPERVKSFDGGATPVSDQLVWPELRPGAATRGDADEPGIADMGADWSHELELRARLDRPVFRQLERIRVVCEVINVSGQYHAWMPPVSPNDRYLIARVRAFDSKGKLLPMTEFYKHEGREPERFVGGGGWLVSGTFLNPGDRYRVAVEPNLIYDMTRPGEYWILVEMQFGPPPPHGRGYGMYFVRAQPIKVKVEPEAIEFRRDGPILTHPDRP